MKFIEVNLLDSPNSYVMNVGEIWGLCKKKDGYEISLKFSGRTVSPCSISEQEFNRLKGLLLGTEGETDFSPPDSEGPTRFAEAFEGGRTKEDLLAILPLSLKNFLSKHKALDRYIFNVLKDGTYGIENLPEDSSCAY